MRHNNRPKILASALPAHQLSLHPGESRSYVCGDCGRWTLLHRGVALTHRTADGMTRCPGSGQRIVCDITPVLWAARVAAEQRDAGLRRAGHVHRTAKPPAPPAVHQLAAT
ncbi:MAG: hypothetical protein ACRDS0_03840 [Pseudonocardiaceae bacterium]